MRIDRLVLALAPIVVGACSDDGAGANTTAGGTSSAGPTTGGPVTGTTGATTGGPSATAGPSTTGGSTTGGPTTTGVSGTVTTNGNSTMGSTTGVGTTGTTDGGTTGGGAGGATSMGGMGGTGGGTVGPMTCPYTPPEVPATFPDGWTAGEVTVFNENGGWTWYNDERVVVDAEAGKLIVSSAASSATSDQTSRNIDAVIHDLATGMNDKMQLGSLSYSDDHNNGGIVIKAPGSYFVAWAHHNVDCNTYWRNYDNGMWGPQVTHRWGQGCPWGTRPDQITYNNPWKLSSEGRYYNFIRSVETSPNFLVSEDEGQNWSYGGRLTATQQQGYNAGYYKFWGNGVDRIDFFATESHPRDSNTSVFHGYIKGGKSYDSLDNEIDADIFDGNAPGITQFTTVFRAGGTLGAVSLRRLWNFDIARYEDGTIGVLWQGRENECADKNNCNPGHHVAYSRFNGSEWRSTYLVKGGRTLYRESGPNVAWWEEDYLGGAALDPDDPHVIYVSTNIDPRDNSTVYPVNEIWKGVSCDDGASFVWTPMTMNSQNENLRPVVPKWDTSNTAVLWFRGNYQTAQKYSAQVVGILTRE
jgi:hypothetical protein